jgi:hypothetical protein
MRHIILTAFGLLIVFFAAAQQHRPPSPEERMKRTREVLDKEVNLTPDQVKKVEMAFADFFKAADQLRKDNPPPPPPPPDPKVKEKMDQLEALRDEKIRKVLTADQYEKYKAASSKLKPPPPGSHDKQGPPRDR